MTTMLSTECVNDWCRECRVEACLCDCHSAGAPVASPKTSSRPRSSATRERVFAALVTFHERHGYAPSTRDLSTMVGVGSGTINHHVHVLEALGRVTFEPGCPRTLTPVKVNH